MHQIDGLYILMNKDNVKLAALDLNLLTALHALLETASVSGAAASVGRTQSAMSHSLARLRSHFQDPLLVRDGWDMQPTPFAEEMRPMVNQAADLIAALFQPDVPFEPATSKGRIKIAAPDLCIPLFSPLIAAVAQAAPAMTVELLTAPASIREAVLHSEADIGFVFGHPQDDPNLDIHTVSPLQWCTFARPSHPYARHPDTDTWAASAHIVVGKADMQQGPVETRAAAHDIIRTVRCHAPNFNAALTLAADCNALFTTLREPFEPLAQKLGLIACPLPFEMPNAPTAVIFRAAYGDPFQLWLRTLWRSVFKVGKH